MSSKILSVQDSKRWKQRSRSVQTAPPLPPPQQEFRGLPNRAIITIVLTLSGFGLMAVFSASAPDGLANYHDATVFLRKQAIACLIGMFLMFYISRYDYRRLKKWTWPLACAALGLLLLTFVPGLSRTEFGSSRWIQLGPIQFQPSELCKIASILLLASGLSKYFWWHRMVLLRVAVVLSMTVIVAKQPDLGSAMMIGGGLLALLYASGINQVLLFGAMLTGGPLLWHHIKHTPYQLNRILAWLHPEQFPQTFGWNTIQAEYAIGSGGWLGEGFGRSLQKLYYLPVQHADFIFAVIAEEFGFLGCLVILALFALFAYYGFKTALEARTLFGRFLAIGITSSITMQAMVNVMVTSRIIPVTGITLPFISYGGTSLVATLAMVGVLLSVSRDYGNLEEEETDG